jgi:hypothetical protein
MSWVRTTRRILIGAGLLFGAAIATLAFLPRLPAEAVSATVTSIYPQPHADSSLPSVEVVARTEDGLTGRMSIPLNQLRCRVGDRVRAQKRGISLRLDQSSCTTLGKYP